MTIVGKILVFVNFVFALIVGGLVMVVFVTRTNWEEAYKKRETLFNAAIADRDQVARTAEEDKKKSDDVVAKLRTEVADLKKAVADAKTEIKSKEDALQAVSTKERSDAAQVKAIQDAADARAQQVRELEKSVETLRVEKRTLIAERSDAIRERIEADVKAKSASARALALEEELRDMQRELVRKSSPAGTTGASRKRGEENPPAENVEGKVVFVDDEDSLAELSVGSDAGLQVGHTLKVFRLHPVPEQSKYLGVFEIVAVRPHKSVAKPMKTLSGRMQAGDRVAAQLLTGN
jgi:hypothetical protein